MTLPLTGKTKVIGIIGHPIEHSLSPLMQNAAFQHLGLDYCYVPFPVAPEAVEKTMEAVRVLGLAGLNITVPYKEVVLPFLDEVASEARPFGAVNTVVNRDGRLIGYNTDGPGFILSLREDGCNPEGQKITVLGAGGAARGIVTALAPTAGEIIVYDMVTAKARELAEGTGVAAGGRINVVASEEELFGAVKESFLVVNTTPVGMYPRIDESPLPEGLFRPGQTVYDAIYRPFETMLLRQAREAGAKTISGLGMLAYQGAIGFKLWTGKEAPVQLMKKVLMDYLSKS